MTNDDDDIVTPPDRPPIRRHASDAAIRLARACTITEAIAAEFGAIGALLDRLETNTRVARIRGVAEQLRATGAALAALGDDLEAASSGA